MNEHNAETLKKYQDLMRTEESVDSTRSGNNT